MGEPVIIVGAGPSGLAISACLKQLSIPSIILEREDCCASLWKKRAYDRLHLHLAKEFCSLPYMEHVESTPTFMTKNAFIQYIDDYTSKFDISPLYHRSVELATYDENAGKWRVEAKNIVSGEVEVYYSKFLVVATGENEGGIIPSIPGLESFKGEIIHSQKYKSGRKYKGKKVLVIGCGNSGMEIAYDLSNFEANTSIVIRSPLHVLDENIVYFGMVLLKTQAVEKVDDIVRHLEQVAYGDLSRYGIHQPKAGPFLHKILTGKTPVLDVGTINSIREGKIKVVPGISRVNENNVVFENGDKESFDALVFATGYRSVANRWLKDYSYVLNDKGKPKNSFPKHWKGEKGSYCVGFSGMGLAGISRDARDVANDIKLSYDRHKTFTLGEQLLNLVSWLLKWKQ